MRRIKSEAAWATEVRRRYRKQRGESSASISPPEMESYYRYSLSCQRLHSELKEDVLVGTPVHVKGTTKVNVLRSGLGLQSSCF